MAYQRNEVMAGGYMPLPQAIGKYNELQVVPVVILFFIPEF